RLLATENILLPPRPKDPWDWPRELEAYKKRVILPGSRMVSNAIPYNVETNRKLGRYLHAVAGALRRSGRLSSESAVVRWLNDLHWPLWNLLRQIRVLQPAGS